MFWFGFNPFRWLIYHKIIEYPLVFSSLLVLLIIGGLSSIVGWPAYTFLLIILLIIVLALLINKKNKQSDTRAYYGNAELSHLENNGKWQMGILTFFALLGNIIASMMSLYSFKHDHNFTTTISVMALFQFIFIGIPYLLMSQVKRKSSFWYGMMSSIFLFAAIHFLALCIMIDSMDIQITSRTFSSSFIKRDGLLIIPLLVVPIMLLLDSLGKSFGFSLKDVFWDWGYNKKKHNNSIQNNIRLSIIGLLVSFIWSLFVAYGCYRYFDFNKSNYTNIIMYEY